MDQSIPCELQLDHLCYRAMIYWRFCSGSISSANQSLYYDSYSLDPYTDLGIRPSMMLAGKTQSDVKAMIDRWVASDRTYPKGTAYIMSTNDATRSLRALIYPLAKLGYALSKDINIKILKANSLTGTTDALFYFQWLASVPNLTKNAYPLWAVGDHLTSYGGRLTDSTQMSILEFISAWLTASYGTVTEPYAIAGKFPDPAIMITHYSRWETLIEAYWKSVSDTAQGIFVGEPLANPWWGQSPASGSGVKIPLFTGKWYFVDAGSGDDGNPGTVDRPWKTLARASTATLASGDALLLNCSSTWRERMSLTKAFAPQWGILIAGYGACDSIHYPTIKWSDIIPSKWVRETTLSGTIYSTFYSANPSQIFVGGKRLIKARYPNFAGIGHEYNILKQANNGKSIILSDTDRSKLANKDVAESTIYIRSEPWYVDKKYISQYNSLNATVSLDGDLTYSWKLGDGYVLEGKKWMLDAPGEWYYDTTARKLFVWFPDGINPTQSLTEASIRNESLVITGISWLHLEHILSEQTAWGGIWLQNLQNADINDIIAKNDKNQNITLDTSKNIVIHDSQFSGATSTNVLIRGGIENTVRNSTISNLGLDGSPENALAAINMSSLSGIIQDNIIEYSAYIGIRFENKEWTKILQNTVKNVCIRLSDCAGIYTWNGNYQNNPKIGSLVEKNTILGSQVNMDGAPLSHGAGIYLDNFTTHVTVRNNMISDVGVWLVLNEPSDTVLTGNKVWKASRTSLIAGGRLGYLYRNKIADNEFFAARYTTENTQWVLENNVDYAEEWYAHAPIGQVLSWSDANMLSKNKIITFSDDTLPMISYYGKEYGLNEWNSQGAQDMNYTPITTKNASIITKGDSLIQNSEMDGTGKYWSSYFLNRWSWSLVFAPYPGCTGICARFIAGNGGDLLISSTFTLDPTNTYVIRYTALAGKIGMDAGSVIVRRAGTPYESFGYNAYLPKLLPWQKVNIQALFHPTNIAPARIDLYGKPWQDIYYDSVWLSRVASYSFFDPYKYSAHVINNTAKTKTFSCADVGLPVCTAIDDQGNTVTWPITLNPYTSMIVLAKDPSWIIPKITLPPTVNFSSSLTTITPGVSIALVWSSTNATSCTTPWGNTSTGWVYTLSSLSTTTEFSVTCSGWWGNASKSITITVKNPPSTAINGVCGSVNGWVYAVPPTNNLCASGIPSNIALITNWTTYIWTCLGANGGSSRSCSATKWSPKWMVPVPIPAPPPSSNVNTGIYIPWAK